MKRIIFIISFAFCMLFIIAKKSIYVGYCGYSDNPYSFKYDTTLAVLEWNDSAVATQYIKPLIDDFAYSLIKSGKRGTRLFDYQIILSSYKQFDNLITISETLKHGYMTTDCRGVIQYIRHTDCKRDSVLVYINYDKNSKNIIKDCFKNSGDSIELYLSYIERPKSYYKHDSSETVFIDLIYDGHYNLFIGALDDSQLLPIKFIRQGKRITDFNRNITDSIIILQDYHQIFNTIGIENKKHIYE